VPVKLFITFLLVIFPISLLIISWKCGNIEAQFDQVMGLGIASNTAFFLKTSLTYYLVDFAFLVIVWIEKKGPILIFVQKSALLVGVGTTFLAFVILLKVALLYMPFSTPISRVLTILNIQNL